MMGWGWGVDLLISLIFLIPLKVGRKGGGQIVTVISVLFSESYFSWFNKRNLISVRTIEDAKYDAFYNPPLQTLQVEMQNLFVIKY